MLIPKPFSRRSTLLHLVFKKSSHCLRAVSLHHICPWSGFLWGYDVLTIEICEKWEWPLAIIFFGWPSDFFSSGRRRRIDWTILTLSKVPSDGRKTGRREPIFQPPHGHLPVILQLQDNFYFPESVRQPASHLAVPARAGISWPAYGCSETASRLLRMADGIIWRLRDACLDIWRRPVASPSIVWFKCML